MILVDSSVWIEHLRATGSRAHREFRELATSAPSTIATCEPIAMELLSGPTDPFSVRRLEDQLGTLHDLPIDPARDFRAAAALARAARSHGHTIRSVVDCLIAAIALRHRTTLWHCDADFARIADVSGLDHRDLREDAG